jgi:DNA-binding response OmpR family regulator
MKKIVFFTSDKALAQMFSTVLKQHGYELVGVDNFNETLIFCEDLKPDMLLLDWENGKDADLLLKLVKERLGSLLTVVFTSESKIDADVKILSKPIKLDELFQKLNQLMLQS